MSYGKENSRYTIVMNRFREIASVRLPVTVCPGITLSIDARLESGGKPSTWYPPERPLELEKYYRRNKFIFALNLLKRQKINKKVNEIYDFMKQYNFRKFNENKYRASNSMISVCWNRFCLS